MTHAAISDKRTSKAVSYGRAVALLFGVITVALVVTRSELARTYYAHRGDLVHQLDAGATAPRYGVPHLLYVVNMATLGVAVVGIVVWVVASLSRRAHG